MSRLRLPLSDHVLIVLAGGFLLHLKGGRYGDKDIDRGCVDIVVVDKEVLLRSETNRF